MSLLDSFFSKGFKAAKCKTLLKLTIPRIKLLRNRRELQIKQMRKDIAQLLETGQEATARIRVEHIIREENMMAAQEIIELYCELISVRLPIIETQRECPLDLKEAISSICFVAPRCADLPELLQVQMAFASKYGKEFVAASTGLLPDCGVNRQLIELLSVRAPSAEKKLKLLKDIAEEHGLEWDPAASETELLKSHEDLLNGPNQFVSGSKVELPKEKCVEVHTAPVQGSGDVHESDSDPDLDMLSFPEVPKSVKTASSYSASAKQEVSQPPMPSAPHQGTEPETLAAHCSRVENPTSTEHSSMDPDYTWVYQYSTGYKNPIPVHLPSRVPDDDTLKSPQITSSEVESSNEYGKQFVPFISAPSGSSNFSAGSDTEPAQSQPLPTVKSETKEELQDVILAAQRAAESADTAAAAARSAASLAQLRISELSSGRKSDESSDDISDNPFALDNPTVESTRTKMDGLNLEHHNSSGYVDETANFSQSQRSQVEDYNSPFDVSSSPAKFDHDDRLSSFSYEGDNNFDKEGSLHQPQRMPSTEDDLCFTYPSLFRSGGHSFTETSHSNT